MKHELNKCSPPPAVSLCLPARLSPAHTALASSPRSVYVSGTRSVHSSVPRSLKPFLLVDTFLSLLNISSFSIVLTTHSGKVRSILIAASARLQAVGGGKVRGVDSLPKGSGFDSLCLQPSCVRPVAA